MNVYKPFAVTVTGSSHTKHGKDCQDSSYKYENTEVSIAAVADGHGDDNCFRSAKGAAFAVICAIDGIFRFVEYHKEKFTPGLFKKKHIPLRDDFNQPLHDIVKHIIAQWQIEVEKDYTAFPFTAEELEKVDEKHRKKYETDSHINKAYGTTLIASAITSRYWLSIHIGDGRLTALYPDGSFDQPVPWDKKCFLNATTSICDDDAFERARCYFSLNTEKSLPAAVFLCTDGIDDNYPVDGNEKHLFKLYRTIALTFAEDGFESTCEQLKALANSFATKGKGDDTSIAGFINMEALKQTVPVLQKQIAEEENLHREAEPETVEPKVCIAHNIEEANAAYKKQVDSAKNGNIYEYGSFLQINKPLETDK